MESLKSSYKAFEALDDEALALACGEGDLDALGELFERYCQPLSRFVHRLVSKRADVEDLVQTTFVDVAAGRATYDPTRGKVITWLMAIATNKVRNHRRAGFRQQHFFHMLESILFSSHASGGEEPSDRLSRAKSALQRLSPVLREAFVVCELEGLSAKEAALVLGASERAIWKRVSNARKQLRKEVLDV